MFMLDRPMYGDEGIPVRIRVDRIIPAASNEMDEMKVGVYIDVIRYGSSPPAIAGYPSTIYEGDIDDCFIDGRPITEEHVGEKCLVQRAFI